MMISVITKNSTMDQSSTSWKWLPPRRRCPIIKYVDLCQISRPVTPEIDDEGFARGMNGYKSYSNAVAANAQKSSLQKKKEQYAHTALSGQRYDSEEDAEFEPEVQSSERRNDPPVRKASGSSVKDDEWAHLDPQATVPGGREFYTDEELSQMDRQSESSGERSRKVCRLKARENVCMRIANGCTE